MYLAKIRVTLKPSINDPQGVTVKGALHNLGFSNVVSVRMGKYIEIKLNGEEQDKVCNQVTEMCRKLLANPVIEDFSFDLERI
jgi:phosphoribosylformylglycinamidine synthase PurS subunit